MATIKVKYTKTFEQTIDWPDDELDDFSYESLLLSLDEKESNDQCDDEIISVKKNGEEYDF